MKNHHCLITLKISIQVQWERATANNALKFKESVESGQFIPEEIRKKLEQKVNRTPQEEEILQKEKQMQSRKEKVSNDTINGKIIFTKRLAC